MARTKSTSTKSKPAEKKDCDCEKLRKQVERLKSQLKKAKEGVQLSAEDAEKLDGMLLMAYRGSNDVQHRRELKRLREKL